MIYLVVVVGLMLVLPVVSIAAELLVMSGPHDLVFLIGKWFVFWGSGARLAIAGLRQVAQPDFTARDIFDIADPAAAGIVRELGFGNLSLALIALLSLLKPDWLPPAALASGLFYGLAGLMHLIGGKRGRNELIAMVSDLGIFLVLAFYLIAIAVRG